MPLDKSGTKEAFSRNVATEMHAGKPQNQALAIAYDVKRRKRAIGGPGAFNIQPKQMIRNDARMMTHQGPIKSIVPGRTDNLPMHVASSSYVLPADHISSLGEGNTEAGHTIVKSMFAPGGPYGVGSMKIAHGPGAPRASLPKAIKFASGGASDQGGARGDGHSQAVPIYAAGGEHVLSPDEVRRVSLVHGGGGDPEFGHKILDAWVIANRKKHVKTLKGLPPPAKK